MLYLLYPLTIILGFIEIKKEKINWILYLILNIFGFFLFFEKNQFLIILFPLLVSQCLIDFYKLELSNINSLLILLIGILYSFNFSSFQIKSIIAISLFYIILYILPFSNLGFGDVKLVIPLSMFLEFKYIPSFIFYTLIFSLIIGIIYRLVRKENIFPMGPAIIITFIICFILQN